MFTRFCVNLLNNEWICFMFLFFFLLAGFLRTSEQWEHKGSQPVREWHPQNDVPEWIGDALCSFWQDHHVANPLRQHYWFVRLFIYLFVSLLVHLFVCWIFTYFVYKCVCSSCLFNSGVKLEFLRSIIKSAINLAQLVVISLLLKTCMYLILDFIYVRG